MTKRIVIVGAGIAGLSAAYRAHRLAAERKLDAEIIVLESSARIGGVIESVNRGGCVMELGPDSIITEKPWARALCEEIGLGPRIVGTRNESRQSFVALGKKLHPIPEGFYMMAPSRLSPFAATGLFSWAGKLRMAADLVLPRRSDAADESLASFVRRRLGSEALERAAQPMVGGVYTADPEKLSLRATMPRFVEMERKHRSLILGLIESRRRAARGGDDAAEGSAAGPRYSLFISLDRGLSVLPERLRELLPDGAIRNGVAVERIEREGDRWNVFTLDDVIPADAVCIAAPAYATSRMLEGVAPELARSLNLIEYASSATVNLVYRRDAITHPLNGFGFVVPASEKRTLLACTFSSVKYPGRAPAGSVLLRAFVGGALFPEVYDMPDDRILAGVDRDLADLVGIHARPTETLVTRWPRSMPQYNVGHLERVARIEEEAGRFATLALAGAAYRGVGIPDCVRSGEAAAERLVTALGRA
ncbi:MAG TPA: protoporphyrinogen oxidase [Candidatus Limnocylindrales bacterium]|nr:protoporphyrinogen oxidase [Candidatus Limnocylindrales bacterium]